MASFVGIVSLRIPLSRCVRGDVVDDDRTVMVVVGKVSDGSGSDVGGSSGRSRASSFLSDVHRAMFLLRSFLVIVDRSRDCCSIPVGTTLLSFKVEDAADAV